MNEVLCVATTDTALELIDKLHVETVRRSRTSRVIAAKAARRCGTNMTNLDCRQS